MGPGVSSRRFARLTGFIQTDYTARGSFREALTYPIAFS